jgi:hypothetical protein
MKKFVANCAIYGIFAAAVFIIIFVINKRERFGVPEFLDRTMQERTAESWHSSYAQKTNHLASPDAHLPPRGQATGHRVGLFEAHTEMFSG